MTEKQGAAIPATNALPALLADQQFCADWAARLPYRFDARGRNTLLSELVRATRVLHLGFADHGPLIAEKRQQGVWLHDAVARSAARAVGVDINAEAVQLAQQLGVADIHCLDLFSSAMAQLVQDFKPDYWLLPDVLEHLQAPVAFLQRMAALSPDTRLVISVPNGLSLRNWINAVQGVERINTDHLCWYSPFTILKLLSRAGYEFDQLWATQIAPAASWPGRLLQGLVARRPLWADNLIVCAHARRK